MELYDLETKAKEQLLGAASAIRASPDGRYLLVKEEGEAEAHRQGEETGPPV